MYRLILWAVFVALLCLLVWRLDHFKKAALHLGHSLEQERADYAETINAQNTQIAALEKSARATAEALQIAAETAQAARSEADELRRKLRAEYEKDPASKDWAATPLPGAVVRVLKCKTANCDGI